MSCVLNQVTRRHTLMLYAVTFAKLNVALAGIWNVTGCQVGNAGLFDADTSTWPPKLRVCAALSVRVIATVTRPPCQSLYVVVPSPRLKLSRSRPVMDTAPARVRV